MPPITAVLLGAGGRGFYAYGPYALDHPGELKFIAVAEPNPVRRERFAQAHGIPAERQFAGWEDLLARGQMADTLFNMTQDQMHHPSTIPALEAGYHILLEKPMATTLAHCVDLVQTAERTGRLLQVCHVLRYTPYFAKLNEILGSGRLGEIITVEHRENVVYWHMAHSFVRGNWRNADIASPMILAKCCHDLDILFWNMGQPVQRLNSFGSLIHFRSENAPAGATQRCTDGCPVGDVCAFDARRLYLNPNYEGWPISAISEDLSMTSRQKALETGPYGRCVYDCDNNVVDHQTVNMEFPGGKSVVLFMHGHAYEEGRTMRYDGTQATLRGKFTGGSKAIEIHDHLTGRRELVDIPEVTSGHGGGDFGIVRSFLAAVRGEEAAMTTARESLESHLMAFAAEEARLKGTVIGMAAYRHCAEIQNES